MFATVKREESLLVLATSVAVVPSKVYKPNLTRETPEAGVEPEEKDMLETVNASVAVKKEKYVMFVVSAVVAFTSVLVGMSKEVAELCS